MDHTLEQFQNGVRLMAITNRSIQERILDAFIQGIGLLETEAIPPEMRPVFDRIRGRMTARGDFESSALSLTDEEATEVARAIFDIYVHLQNVVHN